MYSCIIIAEYQHFCKNIMCVKLDSKCHVCPTIRMIKVFFDWNTKIFYSTANFTWSKRKTYICIRVYICCAFIWPKIHTCKKYIYRGGFSRGAQGTCPRQWLQAWVYPYYFLTCLLVAVFITKGHIWEQMLQNQFKNCMVYLSSGYVTLSGAPFTPAPGSRRLSIPASACGN